MLEQMCRPQTLSRLLASIYCSGASGTKPRPTPSPLHGKHLARLRHSSTERPSTPYKMGPSVSVFPTTPVVSREISPTAYLRVDCQQHSRQHISHPRQTTCLLSSYPPIRRQSMTLVLAMVVITAHIILALTWAPHVG